MNTCHIQLIDASTVSPSWKGQHVIVYGLYNIVCAVQRGHIYFTVPVHVSM